jgi:glycosyltransferase involved in cell wall biosynthesis
VGLSAPSSATPVGILVPTFNRREYLRLALASALAQTHDRLEVVVVDNGSADGTSEEMRAVGDRRVRYVVNPSNLGMARSINAGMSLFSPEVEWATVLADDDLLDPGFVQAAIARAAEARAGSVVAGHRVFVNAGGERLRDALLPPLEEPAVDYLEARSRGRRETFLTGLLFRRAAFDALGGYPVFPTGLASDDALLVGLGLKDRIVHAPDARASVRLHGEAESRTARDGVAKLESLDAFRAYCAHAADAAGVGPAERARLARAIERYRRGLKSHWWQVSMRAAADAGDGADPAEVAGLRALVGADPASFSRLVRLSAWLGRTTGVDLESSKWYRGGLRWLQGLADAVRGLPRVR